MRLLLKWFFIGAVIFYLPYIIVGITVSSYKVALIFALVLTILHYTVRPILWVLTLPINILTLGLFSLILNTAMFALTSYVVDGIHIKGFWAAFFGALLVSIGGEVIDFILRPSNSY